MIRKVLVRNPKDEVLTLELKKPELTGINVKNITGVTPMGAEIYITPFGSIDGGVFAGARVPSRNIVFTLGMLNNPTDAEPSRMSVYNFFRIKDPINMIFYTGSRILQINGYTESVEADIFSKSEEVTVSIICVDPWFYSLTNSQIGFSGTMPMFEFEFSNESLEQNLLMFGDISIDTRTDIQYNGDIATGFNISITFMGDDFHNIYIYNMDTRERMNIYTDQITLLTGDPLSTGDELLISTVSGKKTAYLLRNGEFYNAISAIDKNADWFKLTKGNNVFAFSSDRGVENIVISFSYQDAYGGI